MATLSSEVPASGSLAEHLLPRLLVDLYTQRFCGCLRLSRARTEKSFVLQDGAPVASESNLPREALGVQLADAGTLTRADAERVAAHAKRKSCPEAAAVLSLQLLDTKALFLALKEQLRRRLLECFGWPEGAFETELRSENAEGAAAMRTDPFRLVQDGLRDHWSPERLLASLEPNLPRYPRPGARFAEVVRRLDIDAALERLVAGLGGSQTLGTLVGAAMSSPSALAAFWILDAANALQYSDRPMNAGESSAIAPEIVIEVTGAHEGSTAAAAPARSQRPAKARDDATAEKMRAEVLDRLERLDELDHYELLGVERNAVRRAIRKAYFVAAKRYHPDALARLGLGDLRAQAGKVFARIAEANEILTNGDRRREYDAELEGGAGSIDVATITQAETFFRKGEILVRMGDFRGALEYLQNAVSLYPQEPAYQRLLGWTYFKKAPPEIEKAVEHLEQALALDPSDTETADRIGMIRDAG